MKCPKCGKEIANDSKFCEHCGAQVNVSAWGYCKSHAKALVFFICALLLSWVKGLHVLHIDIRFICMVCTMLLPVMVLAQGQVNRRSTTRTASPTSKTNIITHTQTGKIAKSTLFEVGDYYNNGGKKGVVYKVTGDKLHGQFFRIERTEYTWDESYKMAMEAGGRLGSYKDMQLIGRNYDMLDVAARNHLPYSLSQISAVWISDKRNESIFFNKEDNIGDGLPEYPGGINEFKLLYPVFVFDF